MPSQPLRIHGPTHLADGQDPIPGLRSSPLEVIIAYGNITPGSGATPAYIDLFNYATSDESVFTLQLGTGGLSAIHGIAIHEEGIYRSWSLWQVDSGTVGDTLEGDLDVRNANTSFWSFANTQGTENQVVFANSPLLNKISYANLFYIGGAGGPTPVVLPALIFSNALSVGGHNYHIEFEIVVERLATSYTSNVNTPV